MEVVQATRLSRWDWTEMAAGLLTAVKTGVCSQLAQQFAGFLSDDEGPGLVRALSDEIRRLPALIPRIQLRAMIEQKLRDQIASHVRRTVQRSLPVNIGRVHVGAQVQGESCALQRAKLQGHGCVLEPTSAIAILPLDEIDAGGSHKGCSTVVSRESWIGSSGDKNAHHLYIAVIGCEPKRSRATLVDLHAVLLENKAGKSGH